MAGPLYQNRSQGALRSLAAGLHRGDQISIPSIWAAAHFGRWAGSFPGQPCFCQAIHTCSVSSRNSNDSQTSKHCSMDYSGMCPIRDLPISFWNHVEWCFHQFIAFKSASDHGIWILLRTMIRWQPITRFWLMLESALLTNSPESSAVQGKLGSGSYSVVHLAFDKKDAGRHRFVWWICRKRYAYKRGHPQIQEACSFS